MRNSQGEVINQRTQSFREAARRIFVLGGLEVGRIIVALDTRKDTCGAVYITWHHAGLLHGLPDTLQEDSMGRVHEPGLSIRNSEKTGVEAFELIQ